MDPKLILMRHGQSAWNRKNIFTGWVDIPLSEEGVREAIEGGKRIAHLPLDVVFTSALERAHTTTVLALLQHEDGKVPVFQRPDEPRSQMHGTHPETIPVFTSSALNERMYGDLQGLNKAETARKFGDEQVHIWRRSYDIAPPGGESLKDTVARALPYFEREIVPHLKRKQNVFVSAHGNSLRALLMTIEKLSPEQIVKRELATGEVLVYSFQNGRYERQNLP